MTKHVAGHHEDGRPRREQATVAETPTEVKSPKRSVSQAIKAVLTIGALASAVAAVLSFWPSPDQADSASMTVVGSIRMPISEYEERSISIHPAAAVRPSIPVPSQRAVVVGIGMVDSPSPAPDSPEVESNTSEPPVADSATPSEETPSSRTPESSVTPSTPSTPSEVSESPTLPSIPSRAPKGFGHPQPVDTRAIYRMLPSSYVRNQAAISSTYKKITVITPDGLVVPPVEAARRIVAVLKQTRTTGKRPDGKVEPLGLRITVNMEFVGLRGEPLQLAWSVLQRSGNVPLSQAWLRTYSTYRLQAKTDHDSGSVDFWVPIPRAAGLYFVNIVLATSDGLLTTAKSEDFG